MFEKLEVKIGADLNVFDKAMRKMDSTLKNLSGQVRTFSETVSVQMAKAEKSFDDFATNAQSAGEGLQSIGESMTTYITLPMIAAGGASIKLASDMAESLNKVKVSFGDSASDVIKWSETSIERMGLASGSALDAAALFGDMGTSMGIARDEASKMSMRLVELGADLASFKNIPVEQAMQALNGVFTGETESLKMLGVVMTETQLKAFALTQGITKNVDKMTEAELVTLRYAFVLDRTKNAQGDFARTADGSANQMRMFTENLKELGASFGSIMLPAFTEAITKLNELTKAFSGVPDETKKTVIQVGALTAGIGLTALAVGTFIVKIKELKDAMKEIIVFGARFNKVFAGIVSALSLFFIFFDDIKKPLKNFYDGVKLSFEGAALEIKLAVNEITIYLSGLRVISITAINSILSIFGIFSDSLNKMKSELRDTIELEQFERSTLKASLAMKQMSVEALTNSDVFKQHLKVVNENAGKTDYLSRSYMMMGEGAKSFKLKAADMNEGLKDSAVKVEDLAKKQESLRKATLDSANALGDAIVIALKNKVKTEEESLASLQKSVAENKKSYDQMSSDVKSAQREITQTILDEYNKQQAIINGTYDELLENNNQSFDQQIKANRDRINEIKSNNQAEAMELIDNKYESNVKSLSVDEELLKDRSKLVEAFAKLALERETQALADNRIVRLEAFEALTEEENKSIRDRVLEQRSIQIKGLETSNGLLFDAQQAENKRIEAERAAELEKIKQDYVEKEFQLQRHINLKLELMKVFNDAVVRNEKLLLEEQTKNVKALDTEIELQQKALELTLPKNHKELMDLLKTFNPDWLKAGKSFGEELLSGLNAKKQSIEDAVKSILSQVSKAQGATVSAPENKKEDTTTKTSNKIADVKLESKAPLSGSSAKVSDILTPWSLIKNSTPFANGGIVTQPTLAMIGEAGQSEAVIPLNRLSDFMTQNDTHIYLDGREITRSIAPMMVDTLRAKIGYS